MIALHVTENPLSGATPAAIPAYERALAAFRSWRTGADRHLATALVEAPSFVMAHLLQAWLHVGSRDPRVVRSASPTLERVARLSMNDHERRHAAAIRALLADDYEGAKRRLGELLALAPRDVLALQMAHLLDHVTGDTARLHDRVAEVLPHWASDRPGHHAVLAMQAFGLVERGDYDRAEATARAALAIEPTDARAHHVMAHVFEMSDRYDDGVAWMLRHEAAWSEGTVVATHCWWHLALFRLAQGRVGLALELFDQRVVGVPGGALSDLIDATALLWRISLAGHDTGDRWTALSRRWTTHVDDAYCSFTDVHAMLAFVGAGDWDRVAALERNLVRARLQPSRYGASTRQLGLPVCRAVAAFGRGNDVLALSLLADLHPATASGLGGSHAQRDVLHLTLLAALQRLRRPSRARRPPAAIRSPALPSAA